VYTGFRDDAPSGDLFWRHADGSGEEQALLRTPEQKLATDWSRDGRFVIYETLSSSGTRWDLWVLPTDGGQQPFAFLRTSFQEIDAHFQPVQAGISKWIAYTSDETGRMEVYVRRFSGRAESPGGSAKWRVSNGGGEQPRWRADGLELYYTKPDLTIVAVEVHPGHMFAAGRVEELFRRPPGHMVVAGDTKFMVARPVEYGQATPVTIVLNWLDGMNQ
jgi:hypothetical protein